MKAIFGLSQYKYEKDFVLSPEKIALAKKRYNSFKILHSKQTLPEFDHIGSWKADQTRYFWLYLIVPLLHGILPSQYYNDICNLQHAMFILSKPSISEADLVLAEHLLKSVYFNISNIWDKRLCILNLHDMIHLPQQVRLTGPLSMTSGFQGEAAMGAIAKSKFEKQSSKQFSGEKWFKSCCFNFNCINDKKGY